jgi:Cytochrome C'
MLRPYLNREGQRMPVLGTNENALAALCSTVCAALALGIEPIAAGQGDESKARGFGGMAMTSSKFAGGMLSVLGAMLLVACNATPAPPPEPAATVPTASTAAVPEVSINAVMVALVDHAAHNLWEVEREGKAPKSDADWANVVEHAIQIAAAGPAITVGGTGASDAVWVKAPSWRAHAQRMSDAGVAALKAANSKNLEGLVTANGQLVEACEACHKEFKPALPTEGIVHGHPH